MFRKFFYLVLFMLIFSSMALASVFEHPKSLVEIVPNLPELGDIKCKFEQEKSMPNSNLVIKSSGEFEFLKEKGVVFKTTFPIESVTSYDSGDYKQINDIVKAISNKKFDRLEAVFNFYFEQNGNKWVLGLEPKPSKQVSKYLKSIEIEGDNNISKMKIVTQNSVVTSIKFY